MDESAYDEYRCRKVGMQVAYFAELFENDGSPTSTIVKSVKRAMAGEYSRELSVKVFAGQCCLIEPGYRQGGPAGVGLRRALLNDRGEVKTELNRGKHKSLQTDRVVLVPGPDDEVRTVRWIYDRFLMQGRTEDEIAAELNARGILTDLGRAWPRATVRQILTSEKYIGNNVCNRRSVKLRRKRVANAPDIWIRADGAFEAIVDPRRFRQVQAVVAARNRRFSDEEMLERLTRLFQRHGDISGPVIDEAEGMPSSGAYAHRFGSLLRAYSLVGVTPDRDYRYIEANRLLRQMHGEAGTKAQIVPIAAITLENPRERSEKTFRAPVDSIGKVGRKKPLTVARDDAGAADGYRLVCGQGRMEAYIALGETHIPAIVVDATEVERLLRSGIESIARRQQRSLELLQDIAILRNRGYSDPKIAEKTGPSRSCIHEIGELIANGEERLLIAVETGRMPLSVALYIARAEEKDVQKALEAAYASGELRGKKLLEARRLVELRHRHGKKKVLHPQSDLRCG